MTDITTVDPDSADPSTFHIGVVGAQWNTSITDALVNGAVSHLESVGVGRVTVARVPGSLELAVTAHQLIESGCDGIVAVGVVIRGDTDHYTIVVNEATRGLTLVGHRHGVPVGNGLLAVHDVQHAIERSQPGPTNKGHEAAAAVVDTLRVLQAIG